VALVAALGISGFAIPTPALAAPAVQADLRGDVDRDGRVDVDGDSDEVGEDNWSRHRGPIVLPNLDDDARRCPTKTAKGGPLPLKALVGCRDGSDSVVNGRADAEDLARLRTVPLQGLSDYAIGTVAVTGPGRKHSRLFMNRGQGWRVWAPTDTLDAVELRRGVEFGLEATDLVRDPAAWNGLIEVRFDVTDGSSSTTDTVVAKVAPLLTHHHRQQAERVLVTRTKGSDVYAKEQHRFVNALALQVKAAGIAAPLFTFKKYDDIWTQDFFEPAYVSMPGANGNPQVMRIMLRSAQLNRTSGRELWERLRGPGIGAVQVGDVRKSEEWTLSSMGNLETIPPYRLGAADYPAGRIVMGHRPDIDSKPARAMRAFLSAQGMQKPLLLDTSWLSVGHVDEFLQFLPADTPRGWRLAVSDPAAGLAMLRKLKTDGYGGKRMFSVPKRGKYMKPPTTTIDQALAGGKLARANAVAARKIAANITTIQRETGLSDAEIVRIPGLYAVDEWGTGGISGEGPPRLRRLGQQKFLNKKAGGRSAGPADQGGRQSAYVPGAINSVVLAPDRVLAARQWGPLIGGKDVFAEAVSAAYRQAGVTVSYIDDWYVYHLGLGEVHCGTNVLRNASTPWWGS